MRLFFLFILLNSALSSGAEVLTRTMEQSEACGAALTDADILQKHGKYWEGSPVTSENLSFETPGGAEVSRLGSGYNGTFYRVEHKEGTSKLVKAYFPKSQDFAKDVKGYQTLSTLPLLGGKNFRRIVISKTDPKRRVLEFDDVKGFELEIYLDHLDQVEPAKAAQVRELYESRVNELEAMIKKRHPKVLRRGDESTTFTFKPNGNIDQDFDLSVSQQNVIINPDTLEMTLIDPR